MKYQTRTLKVILSALIAALLVSITQAEPPHRGTGIGFPNKRFKAGTVATISKLEKGDQFAVVCKTCNTIEIKTVGAPEEVAALCHDGGKIHCSECKEDRVIRRIGPPGKGKVKYIDKHEKNCMFIVPLKS